VLNLEQQAVQDVPIMRAHLDEFQGEADGGNLAADGCNAPESFGAQGNGHAAHTT
jgi:hypothetical protein